MCTVTGYCWENLAVTILLASTVSAQSASPTQSSLQPTKRAPFLGSALSVTCGWLVVTANVMVQLASPTSQSSAAGVEDTTPLPLESPLRSVKVKSWRPVPVSAALALPPGAAATTSEPARLPCVTGANSTAIAQRSPPTIT